MPYSKDSHTNKLLKNENDRLNKMLSSNLIFIFIKPAN